MHLPLAFSSSYLMLQASELPVVWSLGNLNKDALYQQDAGLLETV